jgi:hypothetical protein
MTVAHKVSETVGPLAMTAGGGWITIEAMTQGFNLMAAFFALLAAIMGVIWSYIRIKAALNDLTRQQADKDKDK